MPDAPQLDSSRRILANHLQGMPGNARVHVEATDADKGSFRTGASAHKMRKSRGS